MPMLPHLRQTPSNPEVRSCHVVQRERRVRCARNREAVSAPLVMQRLTSADSHAKAYIRASGNGLTLRMGDNEGTANNDLHGVQNSTPARVVQGFDVKLELSR